MAAYLQGSGSAMLGLILALLAASAMAATHQIPWNLNTNYNTYVQGTSFQPGDILVFTYDSSHSVLKVSQSDLKNCNTGSPLASVASGSPTTVTADSYYICGTLGHCSQGMAISIKLSGTPATPTTPSTPSTPSSPSTPTSPSNPATPETPEGSGASQLGTAAALVGSAALGALLL